MYADLLHRKVATIQELSVIIGNLVPSFPGVEYGQLHHRHLERDKQQALHRAIRDSSQPVELSQDMKTEQGWWLSNVQSVHQRAKLDNPSIVIATDASSQG